MDGDGTYRMGPFARVRWLSSVPGQRDDETYGCVTRGLPMPAEGLGYVVSDAGNRSVRVHAYIDKFGRVFIADAPLTMPPAVGSDLQLVAYEGTKGERGCIEVAIPHARPLRVGEFRVTRGLYSASSLRVDAGEQAVSGLGMPAFCTVLYLACCLFPQREGISLVSSSVRSVLMKLRGHDLFPSLADAYEEACKANRHPRVHAPGVVAYFARMLRDADLTCLSPIDVAPDQFVGLEDYDLAEGLDEIGDVDEPAGMPDLSQMLEHLEEGTPVSLDEARELLGGIDLESMLRQVLESVGLDGDGIEVLGVRAANVDGMPQDVPLPEVRLVRTSGYANTFYLGFDRTLVSERGLQRLFEAEGILNRFLFLAEDLDRRGLVQTATEAQCARLDHDLLSRIGDRAFALIDGTGAVDAGTVAAAQAPQGEGDLAIRIAFARTCEGLRLPYRLEYTMCFDQPSKTLTVDLTSPMPDVMPRFVCEERDGADVWRACTPPERADAALAYAVQLSAVAAVAGMLVSRRVERVVANAWHVVSHYDERCVLSVEYARDDLLDRLDVVERRSREAFIAEPLSFIAALPHRLDYDRQRGFNEVEPLMGVGASMAELQQKVLPPDTDTSPLPAAAMRQLHACSVSDLGIYEEAGRKRVAQQIVDALRTKGDLAGIAVARAAAEGSESGVMRDACRRVCDGIARGELGAEKPEAIQDALADVYGLHEGMEKAARLIQRDPHAARAQLESLVTACELDGWFADSTHVCHRYFDSYAARAVYGLRCAADDAGGRDLRLVADEYYLAHYRLSTMLADSPLDCDTAIDHARRCVELAPSVAHSHLRLARCYFGVFDYASEIAAIKQMLRIAWNPADVGMGLYWMGYALSMTGSYEAGQACYQKAAQIDHNLIQVAAGEATEFATREGTTPRELPPAELDRVLADAGIDLGLVKENVEFIVRAADAAVEAGSYALGRNLLGSATMYLHDDALAPVIESLG